MQKECSLRNRIIGLTCWLLALGPLSSRLPAQTAEQESIQKELIERRADVDVNASGNASGSTAVVSAVNSPKILGISFESFGVQKTVDGSTLTFHVNPANLFCATKDGAARVIRSTLVKTHEIDCNKLWGRVSLSLSADTSRNSIPSNADEVEKELLNKLQFLANQISEVKVRTNLLASRRKLDPAAEPASRKTISTIVAEGVDRSRDLNRILNSSALTAEYVFQQPAIATKDIGTIVRAGTKPPSLHTARLIYGIGAGATPFQATFNFSATFFNERRSGMDSLFRDFRFGAEGKWTLKELKPYGHPTISFAGLFTRLNQEPLGFGQILFNETEIHGRGNIGVFQAKLEIPFSNGVIRMPLSVSYSNRTELIREKDIRGQFGMTLNLDGLLP